MLGLFTEAIVNLLYRSGGDTYLRHLAGNVDIILSAPPSRSLTIENTTMTSFTHFTNNDVAPVQKDISDSIVSGNPVHTTWLHFTGANDTFLSGKWQSTAGVFKGPMNDQIEFCHILEGGARIVLGDGSEFTVKPGDSFVMDNGLQPVWHVDEIVKKSFVIMKAASAT